MVSRSSPGTRALPVGGILRSLAWLLVIGASGVLVRAEARRPRLPEGVVAYEDLVYRTVGSRRARLDVYLPEGTPPPGGRPAVVAIHGGGWRGGSKRHYGPMAAQLSQHGYAVVAVDYLLSRPGTPSWPANLEDVREAVRWTRRHAPAYGIDPARIVALGESAGGHLAALLGTRPAEARAEPSAPSDRVEAVIDFYGPSDLPALVTGPTARAVEMMLGGAPGAVPERYGDASPLRHVSAGSAPMLLFHGADDTHVPPEQSAALARALAAAGVPHRLVSLDNARHGFGFQLDRRDLLPQILAFLQSVWDARGGNPANEP